MARARKKAQPTGLHIGRQAGNGPVLIPATVPDPYEPHKTLAVVKNSRSNAVYALYVRKRLGPPDDADARLEAARRFVRIFERAEIGGASAIDYGRAKVDVSFKYSGIAEATLVAIQELAEIQTALRRHYRIIEQVCGRGMSIEEVAATMQGGAPSGRYRVALAAMLRDGLDMLCEHFGAAVGPDRRWIRTARDGEEIHQHDRRRTSARRTHSQDPVEIGRKIPIEGKCA